MPDPPPARSGMSGLYANLLEPSSTSISRAPIVFKPSGSSTEAPTASRPETAADSSSPAVTASSAQKKLNAAALRFQPTITKRPQVANAKSAKPKISMKSIGATSAAAAAAAAAVDVTAVVGSVRQIVKTTLEDWTGDGDDDVNGYYASSKHSQPRGGKKRRKKNKDTPPPPTNWDDIYEPSRPNSYEEYREGDEKIREMEDWRERVYGKRRRRGGRDDSYDSENDDGYKAGVANRFAPPSKYSFAPPPPQTEAPPPPPPPPPPPVPTVEVPDDASGEDAYARRIRMSQIGQAGYASTVQPGPPSQQPTFYPPPAPQQYPPPAEYVPPPPPTQPPPTATISRAPVRYTLPSALPEEPATTGEDPPQEADEEEEEEEEEERSLRPGQAGFAHRLMSKYGWKHGTGLGADSTGIVQPLRMVAAKAKDSAGRGKIIDKNKKVGQSVEGKFGKMSEVVVLRGMVDGLEGEDEAVLLQEIGEECQGKYGIVERVVVDWGSRMESESEMEPRTGRTRVFVMFTSQLSALRAVNALEGRLFNGNTIGARFFDKDKFESRDFS